MYRKTLDMQSSVETYELPSYFDALARDATAVVTPSEHFGSGWARITGCRVEVHVTTLGIWNMVVLAARKDPAAVTRPQEVEFQRVN